MKKALLVILLATSFCGYGQRYMTRNGFAGFYSSTPVEDIKAENNQVFAAIDPAKKSIAFNILLKSFIFPKALMQEHFNENYVESDKYPNATFTGTYTGDVSLDKEGVYKVMVKGTLKLHNASKEVEVPATLEMKGGVLTGKAQFKIKPEDYNISIPSVVRDKIAPDMAVDVKINCNPVK